MPHADCRDSILDRGGGGEVHRKYRGGTVIHRERELTFQLGPTHIHDLPPRAQKAEQQKARDADSYG